MLDDARHLSQPHFAQRIRAMASVVEDESLLGVEGVHEIGAEADGNPDDAHEITRPRVVLDVVGWYRYGPEKTQIVRRRHKDELVSIHAGPFHRRLRGVVREGWRGDFFFARG